jgi:hypothetical protein
MQSQADLMALHPLGATLAVRDGFVLARERLGRFMEGFFRLLEDAGAGLAAYLKKPVLGVLLGLGEVFLFGRGTKLPASIRMRPARRMPARRCSRPLSAFVADVGAFIGRSPMCRLRGHSAIRPRG